MVADLKGVNIVGYHSKSLGLGAEVRRIASAIEVAGLPVNRVEGRMASSIDDRSRSVARIRSDFTSVILAIAADQLMNEMLGLGLENFVDKYRIGFWYWELEGLTPTMQRSLNHVDELWVGSEWLEEVFRSQTDKEVFRIPMTRPIAPPNLLSRDQLGIPKDKFVFLTTFDYLSVIARKNPIAAVEAFQRAFPKPSRAILIVKSQNGHLMQSDRKVVEVAAGGRSDILFIDQPVDELVQWSLIAASNVLVSLHRSEGLGLHILESMALGKPVIYTDYSAPSYFLNLENSMPVDYRRIPVAGGKGVYPDGFVWADPDLDHAANWMRMSAEDEQSCRDRGEAARRFVSRLPSVNDIGPVLVDRLRARHHG